MNIEINYPENKEHIRNFAFIKALMIKLTIEELNISYEEKETLRVEILKYLKHT